MSDQLPQKAPLLLSTASFALHGSIANPTMTMDLIKSLDESVDGIDLYTLCDTAARIPPLTPRFSDWISSYDFVTLHTSFANFTTPNGINFESIKKALRNFAELYRQLGACELTIHADILEHLTNDKLTIVQQEMIDVSTSFELMNDDKSYGNRIEHFSELFAALPEAGITIDLAHLDETHTPQSHKELFESPELRDRIHLVHGSLSGQRVARSLQKALYGRDGIDHLPCVVDENHQYKDLASLAASYPVVLEGAVPYGKHGLQLLDQEIAWWKALRPATKAQDNVKG